MREKKVLRTGTNYFKHPGTWIKRAVGFILVILFVAYLEYPDGLAWKLLIVFVAGLYLALMPKDDLGVDDEYLYHLQRSLLPAFSRTTKYKISRIKSLGVGGVYTNDFEYRESFGSTNSLELIFKDDSSRILNLRIYKKDLVSIAKKVKERMKALDKL